MPNSKYISRSQFLLQYLSALDMSDEGAFEHSLEAPEAVVAHASACSVEVLAD